MWFFNRKKATTLTDEDRENSAKTRRQNRELKDMEHEISKLEIQRRKLEAEAEIQELKAQIYGDEEEELDAESMLIQILTKGQGLQSLFGQQFTTPPTHSPPTQPSDEELRTQIKAVNPAILQQAKKLNDEQIKGYISQNYPSYSEETINKVLCIIKE